MRLFSWFILRRLRQQPLRTASTALGIALGVAVVVAIQLTNASSVAGFNTALTTISGRASLEISGTGTGVDERLLPELGWLRQYGAVAPIIEGDVTFRGGDQASETLRVLGVDILREGPFRDYRLVASGQGDGTPRTEDFLELLRDPASAVLTETFAATNDLALGSTFEVESGDRTVSLTVRGLLANEGPARVLDGHFILMDIAAAQQAVGRLGRITRIEIRLPDDASVDETLAAIAPRLPPGLSVERPAQRGRQVERMLAAFHANLTALSYVALLVGLFLVYNTVSVAVLSRRDEIGTLRALGTTRANIRRLFLGEAAVLSLAGSAIGIGLGRLLADAALALTSTTVSVLYIAAAAAPPSLSWHHAVLAFSVGVPLSLVAALVPAIEAARVPPIAAIRGAARQQARLHLPARSLWLAVGLFGIALWLARLDPVGGLPLFGYASALAVVLGASLVVPSLIWIAGRSAIGLARRYLGVEDWLAANHVAAAVSRLSISVAALAVSLSMMVAIAIMVGSFRETVIYWVGQTLQADLYVSPGMRPSGTGSATLSPEVIDALSASPEVAAIDRVSFTDVAFGDELVRVGGSDFDVLLGHGTLLFKAPESARGAMRSAIGTNALVASESFSIKHDVTAGDTVPLPTARGTVPFLVAAVYYDYSSDRGVLMLDRETFERYYDGAATSGVRIYLKPGIDADEARGRLLRSAGASHQIFINTNRSLRAEVLRIFDSTFAITYALEIVAILVAMLGVSGTLLTLVLEREPELTILRLVGTGRRQIRRMIVGEALIVGVVSQAIGLLTGLLLSLLLIDVINVQSFGWTIQFHLPAGFLMQSSVALLAATALAALYPARRAAGLTLARDE
jgi:putative ABC transport system permease protein